MSFSWNPRPRDFNTFCVSNTQVSTLRRGEVNRTTHTHTLTHTHTSTHTSTHTHTHTSTHTHTHEFWYGGRFLDRQILRRVHTGRVAGLDESRIVSLMRHVLRHVSRLKIITFSWRRNVN